MQITDENTGAATPALFWRMPDITRETGMKPVTVYAAIRRYGFPRPLKVGRLSMWSRAVVVGWLNERLAESQAAQAAG